MPITTTTLLPAQVQQSLDYRLLSIPTPNLIHSIPAMKKRMPKNGGRYLRMSRYDLLPTSPVPLGNTGVTPPSTVMARVDLDVQMQFYGQHIILNEQVALQSQDPVLNSAVMQLGVSLRMTEDQLVREMLAGTAAQINCTAGVNGDNPTEITAADVSVIIQTLLGNNAKVISNGIEGSDKFGTAPIRNSFFALCDSDLTSDLNDVDGFTHSSQYPQQKNILPSEWGTAQNLRFFTSSEGSVSTAASAGGNDVYNIFCIGTEAYTVVEQDGCSAHFIYRPPVYDGPLALNASAAWKMGFASRITNDLWALNLRATRMN